MLTAMIERETNFNGTIALSDPSSSPSTVANGSYLRPTSRDELVDALKDMSNCDIRPKKIVVVGGFSSFEFPQLTLADEDSDETLSLRGPTSPHLVVDVSRMNKILHVDKQSLTVTVEAGITYWDLANQLREKGLAVENLSAYPEVTVGGASGTGTHGSGHALHGKNQADQFIALEVVNARGDIQRIVDPRLFTHLGVLGVVTAVTLRCIPMFFLKQACYEFADLDVFDSLRIGAFRELAETDDFYSTMIRIDLVDKMHHPVRCYIRTVTTDEDDRAFQPMFLGAPLVDNIEGEEPSAFTGPYYDVLPDHTTASRLQVPAPGTYHQAEYFVDNHLASQAVHAFLREADKDDRFITALPTGLKCRFVSSDDQWMSATSNVDDVELYLALQLSLYGSRSEIDAILKRIEDCLAEAGIPFSCHWGKLCHGGHGSVNRKLKDRAKAMDAARTLLDPDDAFLDGNSELAKLFTA
jgi:L-gulonolactone oxidase